MSNHPTTQAVQTTPSLPAERTWRRYSSHHELPFSLTSSVFLHLLGLLALVLLGILASTSRHSSPLQVGIAVPGDEPETPGGVPNPGGEPQANEAIAQPVPPAPAAPSSPTLNAPQKPSMPLPPIDPKGTHPVDAENIERQAVDVHTKVQKLIGQFRPVPDGPPGGAIPGKPGGPAGSFRRQARWTLVFNTRAGQDYLHQLRDLNAILAVPQPDGQYLVFRELGKQPLSGKVEDISPVTLIRWHDTKPESVQSLARALGLAETPAEIIAFFSAELEQELLTKEMQYSGSKNEEEIAETIFTVTRPRGRAGYEATVTAQQLRQNR